MLIPGYPVVKISNISKNKTQLMLIPGYPVVTISIIIKSKIQLLFISGHNVVSISNISKVKIQLIFISGHPVVTISNISKAKTQLMAAPILLSLFPNFAGVYFAKIPYPLILAFTVKPKLIVLIVNVWIL